MHEFVHGWRRKVGVVTLAMACLVTGMWCRSFSVQDVFGWGDSTPDLPIWFASNEGVLVAVAEIPIGWSHLRPSISIWETDETKPWEKLFPSNITWSFQFCRFGYGHAEFQFLTLPYWSITVPLTLLSASLILWKPRKRTAVKSATPIS